MAIVNKIKAHCPNCGHDEFNYTSTDLVEIYKCKESGDINNNQLDGMLDDFKYECAKCGIEIEDDKYDFKEVEVEVSDDDI